MHIHIFIKHFTGPQAHVSSDYLIVALTITVCCTIGEIICYVLFAHHTYNNDNGNVKNLLDPEITKQRNRKNLTTFLAQFYSFATEVTFLIVIVIIVLIDSTDTTIKALVVVIKIMEFGVLSLVEIVFSDELRATMVEDLKKIKSLFTLF